MAHTLTPPDSADKINQTPSLNMPVLSPYAGNITQANARNAAYKVYDDTAAQKSADEAALYQKEADRMAGEQQKQSSGFLSQLLKKDKASQVRSDALEQVGFEGQQYFEERKARSAEIDTLNQDYNKIKAERDTAINAVMENREGLFGSGLLDSEVQRIERAFAPRLNEISGNINSKTALMEAERGNYQDALAFASMAVDDYTADMKYTLDVYDKWYSQNESVISRLDDKYKTALDTARNIANDKWQMAREKAQLAINRQLANYQTRPGKDSADRFTTTQMNDGAANAGLALGEFQKLPAEVMNYFISSPAGQLTAINDVFAGVQSGDENPEDVKAEIDSSNLAVDVKNYLKGRIDTLVPAEDDSPSFWDKVKDFFTSDKKDGTEGETTEE
jgi:hypothetical protein